MILHYYGGPVMAMTLKAFVGGYRMDPKEDEVRYEVYRAIEDLYPDFDPYILKELHGKGGGVREERALAKIRECDVFVSILMETITPWESMELITASGNRKPIVALTLEFSHYSDKKPFGWCSDKEFLQGLRRNPSFMTIRKATRESAPKIATSALKRLYKDMSIGTKDDKRRSFTLSTIDRVGEDTNSVEWVRAGVVQLDYELDNSPKPKLKSPPAVAKLIDTAMKTAIREKLDLVVFPELAGSEMIEKRLKATDLRVIIGPTRILNGFNAGPIFYKQKLYRYHKLHRSRYQDTPVAGEGISVGDKILLLKTELGRISPLICDDFRHEGFNVSPEADFIVVPSYNPKPKRFQWLASVIVENFHNYILVANCSKYGSSAIYGIIYKEYHKSLQDAGLRDVNAPPCELARMPVKEQGFLTADFNIKITAVSVPTPLRDNYANVRNIGIMDLDGNKINPR